MILEREDYDSTLKGVNNYSDAMFQKWVGTYSTQAMGYHHNGLRGFNAGFFDGHVRFYHFGYQPTSFTDGELIIDNFIN